MLLEQFSGYEVPPNSCENEELAQARPSAKPRPLSSGFIVMIQTGEPDRRRFHISQLANSPYRCLEFPNSGALTLLFPVSLQHLPAARRPAGLGVPRRFGSRPSRSKRRSGSVSRDRLDGRCQWGTRHEGPDRGIPAAGPASTPVLPNDSELSVDALSRAPSPRPSSTVGVRRSSLFRFR